jgi:Uma2 family endonuclease
MGAALREKTFSGGIGNETNLNGFIEFIRLPKNQDKTFELVDGTIVMMAGNVTGTHDRITTFLITEIGHYLKGKQCEVHHDLNVYLFHDDIGSCQNAFQPDVFIGCDRDKVTDRGYEGTPEFIIEVVSKSSARMDYLVKFHHYMMYGVKEYWIVDVFKQLIIVYINGDNDAPDVYKYTFEDTIKISVLENLSIDFKEIRVSLPPFESTYLINPGMI